jgi:nucleotide-binding universal stress UspA family protein
MEDNMKIMVAYDGSVEAKDALKLAQKHLSSFGGIIEVVKSVTRKQPLDHRVIQAAEEELEREIRNQLNGDKTSYETHLVVSSDSTGDNIIWFAEIEEVDEIIIVARKRSKVGKLLLGSTAQHVILNAPCPVVAIK